jgi:hypothetical protein
MTLSPANSLLWTRRWYQAQMTLWRHKYDNPVNTIIPITDQLIEKTSTLSDSWAPAIGPSGADCGDEWQICRGDFRPAYRMRPERKTRRIRAGRRKNHTCQVMLRAV